MGSCCPLRLLHSLVKFLLRQSRLSCCYLKITINRKGKQCWQARPLLMVKTRS